MPRKEKSRLEAEAGINTVKKTRTIRPNLARINAEVRHRYEHGTRGNKDRCGLQGENEVFWLKKQKDDRAGNREKRTLDDQEIRVDDRQDIENKVRHGIARHPARIRGCIKLENNREAEQDKRDEKRSNMINELLC